MADVKWIKIATDIFDDEKILIIEKLPNADSIIVIWFKLLTLAGKQNNSGVFIMNSRIAYTEEMLSAIFRRDLNLVKIALATFEAYGMIEIIEGTLTIPNWSKHQTLDKIAAKTEYQKKYMQEYRKKQKQLACKPNSKPNVSENEDFSKPNVSEIEQEEEKELEIELDKQEVTNITKELVTCLENCTGRLVKPLQIEKLQSYVEDGIELDLVKYILEYSCSKKDPYKYAIKVLNSCIDSKITATEQFILDAKTYASKFASSPSSKVEKFNSMASHDWDFDELEKLQAERVSRIAKEREERLKNG